MKLVLASALLSLTCVVPVAAQQVAFTFDDLPAHGDLPRGETRFQIVKSILNTLHDQQLPPVYGFINAAPLKRTPQYIELLKAWRAAGHPLGSHTYSHPSLNDQTPAQFEAEIEENEPTLASLMAGQDWHWFRYPSLWEGDTLEKRRAVRAYLQQHGYRVAQVSLDFKDFLWNAPYARCVAKQDATSIESLRKSYLAAADRSIALYREATHTLYGRDIPYILLMHVGAFDAKMLPELIELFRDRGFTFITLPEAMKDPIYQVDPDIALKDGGPIQVQLAAARHLGLQLATEQHKELETVCN